jgi:hypothetical protein
MRLDLLNDPCEGLWKSRDGVDIDIGKKNIFCSCWTSDAQESIAMWGVYGRFKGVRIKMYSKLFSKNLLLEETREGFMPVGYLETPYNTGRKIVDNGTELVITRVCGPYSISYVNDENELNCNTYICSNNSALGSPNSQIDFDVMELGNKKMDCWHYEHEWRYKISPFSHIVGPEEVFPIPFDQEYGESFCIPYIGEVLEVILGPCVEEDTINRLQNLFGDKYEKIVRRSSIKMNKE